MRTSMAFLLAVALVSFAPAEAEDASRELGEGMMLGGDDLSKLSYLMDTSTDQILNSLLGSMGDASKAQAVGALGAKAAELKRLKNYAAKLADIAASPATQPG